MRKTKLKQNIAQTMRKLFLLVAVAAVTVCGMHAQMMPQITPDAQYRIGKLDNGLTYYIRHNEYPKDVADFYIAQRVGSIQEEDNQRGLAHFLEHMAFNGSTHFKGNGIIDFTRGLGVAFGRDMNAFTGVDKTVYNICNVPTTRQTALDSCLMVLQDWSCGLLLLPEEIDKERGVVHGEWTARNSPVQRMVERNLTKIFPNCKYGERLPIGLMEVVDSFTPSTLRAYYEKWYHPENQALIVIGNVDVDHTEKMIREMFGGIKAHANAAHVTPVPVPDNEQTIYITDKDKEMPYTVLEIEMKADPLPRELRQTQMTYLHQYLTSMICTMFGKRMSELVREPDCPFVQMSLGYGQYGGLASTKDAFVLTAVPKDNKDKETLAAAVRELRRIKLHGFTAGEYVRAKEEFLSGKEKAYTNRDKRKNNEFYSACLGNYIDGYAMPDAETTYQLWQAMAQSINLDIINQTIAQAITIDSDKNMMVLCLAQDKEGKENLNETDMKDIITTTRTEEVTAWVDNTKDEPLIKDMPKAGKIVKEKTLDTFGYTELTLSNGAKVCLKKTDFKDNEILLRGWARGGTWQYGEKDYTNTTLFHDITETFGLGNFSNSELEKALAGKQCSLSVSMDGRSNNVNGSSTPKDFETMMQLLYLYFTAPQKDEKTYNTLINMVETALKNRDLQPETALSDSIAYYYAQGNKRYANIKAEDLKNVSLDRSMEIMREQFTNANNFTFTITGNFDEQQARQLACLYIGSLPGKGKAVKTKDERTLFCGNVNCDFKRKMETPKPYMVQTYKGTVDNTLRNSILASFVSEVLTAKLLKVVREDSSAVYGISASASINAEPEKSYAILSISAPISTPEKTDMVLALTERCIKEVAEKADAESVENVRKNKLKQFDINLRNNGTWPDMLRTWYRYGIDPYTDFKKIVNDITTEDVSKFLREAIIASGDKLQVVMRPE